MDRKTESVSRPDGKKGVRAGRIYIRYAAAFGILTGLLLILTVWNINSGSIHISVRDILQILFQRQGEDAAYNIVWEIRLPRILAALILGGALSVSGFLLQTFFNNPIAGPFVLGISSGAKLIVSLVMIYMLEKAAVATSGHLIIAAVLRFYDLHGLCPGYCKKSKKYVHAGNQRDHDWVYLFCGNGFCDHLCR